MLLASQPSYGDVLEAAEGGDWAQVAALVAAGAPVNPSPDAGFPPDQWFTTLLHLAVRADATDAVQLLLQHGADVDVEDEEYDWTLLCHALYGSANPPQQDETVNLDIVQALVAAGADITAKICADSEHHASAPLLHWCAYNDMPRSIAALLSGGVDVNVRTSAHVSVAFMAVRVELEHGAHYIRCSLPVCCFAGLGPWVDSPSCGKRSRPSERGAPPACRRRRRQCPQCSATGWL